MSQRYDSLERRRNRRSLKPGGESTAGIVSSQIGFEDRSVAMTDMRSGGSLGLCHRVRKPTASERRQFLMSDQQEPQPAALAAAQHSLS